MLFRSIVGANGSGKSTLVKTILGLIRPVSGKVLFGERVNRTMFGYLPQETKIEQNFPATVLEIVLSGTLGRMGRKSFYGKEEKERAGKALETLKIMKLKNKSFKELSGGQKQKVLLARALAATTDLLILDEPSNNLDYKTRKEFYTTLKKLNTAGLAIIMITNDLDAEDSIGNKILAIKEGEVKMKET